jgi:hypothetical protein
MMALTEEEMEYIVRWRRRQEVQIKRTRAYDGTSVTRIRINTSTTEEALRHLQVLTSGNGPLRAFTPETLIVIGDDHRLEVKGKNLSQPTHLSVEKISAGIKTDAVRCLAEMLTALKVGTSADELYEKLSTPTPGLKPDKAWTSRYRMNDLI